MGRSRVTARKYCIYIPLSSYTMSKRVRRVAFSDEVQVEDKRRREDEAEEERSEGEDEKQKRSKCALIRVFWLRACV